mgnify:CR=1 FL=1
MLEFTYLSFCSFARLANAWVSFCLPCALFDLGIRRNEGRRKRVKAAGVNPHQLEAGCGTNKVDIAKQIKLIPKIIRNKLLLRLKEQERKHVNWFVWTIKGIAHNGR